MLASHRPNPAEANRLNSLLLCGFTVRGHRDSLAFELDELILDEREPTGLPLNSLASRGGNGGPCP
jgi:hypothetical protein